MGRVEEIPLGGPNMPGPQFNQQAQANGFASVPPPQPMLTIDQPWKSDLFDCMDDPTNALITCCFPCVTFGQIAEIVDTGNTSCANGGIIYGLIYFLIAMPCLYSCTYRSKMRNKFGLAEAPAPDWISHFLCECCALCQEYRELQHRGLDPSIGWQGNVMKNPSLVQQPGMMQPPNNQRMMG